MSRYIDPVMVASDRVDERARLLARLGDTVHAVVGDLGPDTPALLRWAVLAAVQARLDDPADVMAEVVLSLGEAVGWDHDWRPSTLGPAEALALAVCDGRGATTHAVAAVLGAELDAVAAARDRARLAVGLPPAPLPCTIRHADEPHATACVACMLVRADAATARARVGAFLGPVGGLVLDRLVAAADAWQADVLRPRLRAVAEDGPDPWSSLAGPAA